MAVTTRSRLRGVRFFPAMLVATVRARRQLARAPGIVRWASVIGGPTEFWTLTVWSGMHEMQEFMRSGAHGEVMWKLPRWLRSFWLARWRPAAAEIGDWDGLQLRSEGRDEPSERGSHEGIDAFLQALADGSLTYDESPLVRRSRAQLAGLGGAVVRIAGSPATLPLALRDLRRLRRQLADEPELIRVFVGVARFRDAYLFGVWHRREVAQRLLDGAWMQRAQERWAGRLWALEWRPENEFGHWDGARMRAYGDVRVRRGARPSSRA